MSKPITIKDSHISTINKALREQGLFVTMGKNPPNLMSTHWGSIGYIWNKWIFVLPVRYNKLSHDIIDETKEFSVSIPYKDLRDYIMKLDTISGRTHDKFSELHLHPVKSRTIDSFVVGDCDLHLECKVVYTGNMGNQDLNQKLKDEMYSSKNFHTMYFAEIVDIYEK